MIYLRKGNYDRFSTYCIYLYKKEAQNRDSFDYIQLEVRTDLSIYDMATIIFCMETTNSFHHTDNSKLNIAKSQLVRKHSKSLYG